MKHLNHFNTKKTSQNITDIVVFVQIRVVSEAQLLFPQDSELSVVCQNS